MSTNEVTIEGFLKDVSRHEMKIIRDEGLYRHLRFISPDSVNKYFDIITRPGNLCYTGDMGTYVFKRLEDMLYFFDDGDDDKVCANYGYWAQKVESESVFGEGIRQYSEDEFRSQIKECFDRWKQDYMEEVIDEVKEHAKNGSIDDMVLSLEHGRDFIKSCWEDVDISVLWKSENEYSAYEAAMEFSSSKDVHGFSGPTFDDFWEVNCRRLTWHYQWCCLALNWAVKKYFKVKGRS